MPNKRQLEESFTMTCTKKIKSHEDILQITTNSNEIISELGPDLNTYEVYKRNLHECEYLFGLMNRLEVIEDPTQDKEAYLRCPLCLQVFFEQFQLRSHKCNADVDFELFTTRTSSSKASTALTSTRKDIGDLLKGIPSKLIAEHLGNMDKY